MLKKLGYDIGLIAMVITLFTVQLIETLSLVASSYHLFVVLFYTIGIALLLLITFQTYEIVIRLDRPDSEENDDSNGFKSEKVVV